MLFKTFYAGGLGEDRDFETVIQAEKDIGEIWVELAENGYYVGYIMNEREFYVMFIVPTPYEEVIWKMLQLGLLFALYYPDAPNKPLCQPQLLPEVMMCGKLVQGSDGVAVVEIAYETKYNWRIIEKRAIE